MLLVDGLKAMVKYEAAGAAYNCRVQPPPTHHHKADEIETTTVLPTGGTLFFHRYNFLCACTLAAHCVQPRAQEPRYYNPSTYNTVA